MITSLVIGALELDNSAEFTINTQSFIVMWDPAKVLISRVCVETKNALGIEKYQNLNIYCIYYVLNWAWERENFAVISYNCCLLKVCITEYIHA